MYKKITVARFAFLGLLALGSVFLSCKHQTKYVAEPQTHGYPNDIAKIMLDRCATAGCHNTQSKDGAAGLDFSSWTRLFEGSAEGSPVIPFRADQSFITYFINTFPDLGVNLLPIMPLQQAALTRQEVLSVINWINKGAPDKQGKVMWSETPDRSKFYVVNQGCNSVTVFDAYTQLPMRYTNIGDAHNKSPHDISVSPDRAHWYAVFLAGEVLQKYSSITDSLVGSVYIGSAQWSSMTISDDSKKAFVIGFDAVGSIALVDLENMALLTKYSGSFNYPHGCAASADFKTLYVTAQRGNFIWKLDISDPLNPVISQIPLDPTAIPSIAQSYNPHQIEITPDGSKYFVSCQDSNHVRVFSTATDSLLAVIKTGGFPQEIEISETSDYLFVSCMEDRTTFPGKAGSVAVINYQTNTFIKAIYTGWQPHGLYVDESRKKVYVANRNFSPDGPAPHHVSSCVGRTGYVTMIDLNTLEMVNGYKVEVGVDPYEVAVKP